MSAKKILIVDDNPDFCANLSDILELYGYETETVANGLAALRVAGEDGFALIMMDIKMPGMNGVETFRKLKGIVPDTPVIMMTAYALEDLIRDALREGAFAAFHKPIDFERLHAAIEGALPDGSMILVVDDDEALCASLGDMLHAKGYRVRIANDGETAARMSRESAFDAVLLDLKLPVLNGLETYLIIRDIRPDIVAIIITGHMGEMAELSREALEKGAYVCLQKPLDMKRLLAALEEIQQ